jgi:aminodeoxyfutalosine deaminase
MHSVNPSSASPDDALAPVPKIELHVHLEGTVRARHLLEMAARNGVRLPADNESDLSRLYQFRDFAHFAELWMMTTSAIQKEEDFRQVVLGYAEEAASHGAVYVEGIFTPAERVTGGASWDEVFTGFCDGALQAKERFGVEMRLTTDTPRNFDLETAMQTARYSVKYRDRGVVGLGIGGPEEGYPPEPFEKAFLLAKEGGIGSVPHAGETAGPESVLGAIDALGADRIRHGIRAMEDPGVVRELVAREIICDVCPVSNLRTGAIGSLEDHPLGAMLEAGILCSISTDDPAMFDTDLSREYQVAQRLGCTPERAFAAGIRGALCGEETLSAIREIGETFDWNQK